MELNWKWIATIVLASTISFSLMLGVAGATPARLKTKDVIELWPGAAPGSENSPAKQTIIERSKVLFAPDRALTGITKPSLTVFLPEKSNGTSMIVAPGGAYARVVLDKEGVELAKWFTPLGVTVFVLQYRLPAEGHINGKDVPLQDGQRAVRLVRQNAEQWGLNPNKIGLLGFSAGGHLAASVGSNFNKKVYQPIDNADTFSARPDFLVLMYPVITMEAKYTHMQSRTNLIGKDPSPELIAEYSPDLKITKDNPQTFITLANDDASVPSENAIRYYLGLKNAGVPAELHIYRDGGHGFGIRGAGKLPAAGWPKLCQEWMAAIGLL